MNWYPKIKSLGIPTPRTEIIRLTDEEKKGYKEGDSCRTERLASEIEKLVPNRFGYPVFIRTDHFSGKHQWENTCFIKSPKNLKRQLFELITESRCCDFFGLPIEAICVREFIEMKTLFTAFSGNMPVNPEIRFFFKDGEVLCWHWYWVEEAIEKGTPKDKLPVFWKDDLRKTKESISGNEILWLTNDVRKVAIHFKGFWSVDFCKAKDNKWILIDMAEGHKSWHPSDCPALLRIKNKGD